MISGKISPENKLPVSS